MPGTESTLTEHDRQRFVERVSDALSTLRLGVADQGWRQTAARADGTGCSSTGVGCASSSSKRLDKGRFRLPEPLDDERVVELSERELDDLLEGIEVERRHSKRTLH